MKFFWVDANLSRNRETTAWNHTHCNCTHRTHTAGTHLTSNDVTICTDVREMGYKKSTNKPHKELKLMISIINKLNTDCTYQPPQSIYGMLAL